MAAPPTTTYQQYYDDAANNPYTNLGDVFVPFTIDPANTAAAPTPAQVAAAFHNSSAASDPNAFIMLHPDDPTSPDVGPGHIHLYHRLTAFPTRMGVAATQWDGRAFVAKGDFVHGMLPVVEFPATAFHLQN